MLDRPVATHRLIRDPKVFNVFAMPAASCTLRQQAVSSRGHAPNQRLAVDSRLRMLASALEQDYRPSAGRLMDHFERHRPLHEPATRRGPRSTQGPRKLTEPPGQDDNRKVMPLRVR